MAGWIMHLNISGQGQVRWGDQLVYTQPGQVMLFAPEAVHDYDRSPGRTNGVIAGSIFDHAHIGSRGFSGHKSRRVLLR